MNFFNRRMPRGHVAKMRGMSLVEMMVAMVIGLLTVAGLLALFVQNKRSFNQDEQLARMQDNARFALAEIERDISMVGYWGGFLVPEDISLDADSVPNISCGPGGAPADWMFQFVDASGDSSELLHVDNATAVTAQAQHGCLPGEVVAGPDVISVKRVEGRERSGALAAGVNYLRTNGTVAEMFRTVAGATIGITVPADDFRYTPRIYFVRNFAETAGDGIPTLCRMVLGGMAGNAMETECLAQGIEDLQVEFGLDEDGDGRADVFRATPTLDEIQRAVSARIEMLARAPDPDSRFANNTTYRIGNSPDYTPNDNFHRRVYSTTVFIRNVSRLRRIGI